MIAKAEEADTFDDLVKYLLMVRKQLKDSKVDTELVYAYAKTNQLASLEEFISGTHFANLQAAGDRCAPAVCANAVTESQDRETIPYGVAALQKCPVRGAACAPDGFAGIDRIAL